MVQKNGLTKRMSLLSTLFTVLLITAILYMGNGDAISTAQAQKSRPLSTNSEKVYIKPGSLDQYYLFAGGGLSGNVYVYGVPSMRRIRTIPVFSTDSARGYGWDKHSKAMLEGFTWGDAHHPALSETNGEYDGRWLFVNDNANNRAALVDLKTFTTRQIIGPVPNIMGPHGTAFVTPNTEYFFMPSRFSVPLAGQYAPLEQFTEQYYGVMAAIKMDKEKEKMELAWQVLLPPWSYDISDAGKKISDGWSVMTTYNTEEAAKSLAIGTTQAAHDYLVLFNWKEIAKQVSEGKYKTIAGAKVFDPAQYPGSVYLVPVEKNPHGVDVSPDGKYYVASGKLSPTVTVYDWEKTFAAIKNKAFQGTVRGLRVLNLNSVKAAQVTVGKGPLHTQFDDKGYAYTTLFVDHVVVKWKLGEWKVADKAAVQYAPGHLSAAEGDTVSPDGKWLVSINKWAKDSYLSVGPSQPDSLQLIDISGEKMKVIYNAPADPEPHYAQIVKADKLKPIKVIPKDEKRPDSIWKKEDARIERDGKAVHVYAMVEHGRFYSDEIKVKQGERVIIHMTNADLKE
ncbi:Sec-dependent nitrous-oxide reductase, partial [uncultured Paenibacillus sp.]|uniref:Sec-dependent nitrous-oxide reductase n=1 Tax=uncultured Paenibacillus sp. TaxID=227322 RepID=UPI0028D57F35